MCGIAGILNFDPMQSVEQDKLRRMTRVIAHRGPDGEGYFHKSNIGLGHRRLAIIDLTTGDQPMFSEDGSIVLVFNGEIYNYLELKVELEELGHRFRTTSDTEVIIAAYLQWGFECQKRFNGMWAYALWDAREKLLFLSRDRMGEKPLHFAERSGTFIFGSEIKSLLAYNGAFEPATEFLNIYLSLGYIPAPYTLFKGISRLEPGHYLVVRNGKARNLTYWDLPDISEADMRSDADRTFEEFEDCFLDSVKIRMRSDVPFGAFLSGGLDSSSIVAAMSEQSQLPIETFTIGFSESGFDERALARQVAQRFHTNHREKVAIPDVFDQSLQLIRTHFDEPFGDASAIPVGMVSGVAREYVTMVLTGDGGDEVLSGYTNYVTEKLSNRYSALPGPARSGIHLSVILASKLLRGNFRYRANRVERFLRLAGSSYNSRALAKMSTLSPEVIGQLIPSDLPQVCIGDFFDSVMAKCRFSDGFYRQMYFNLKVSLPDDMLTKVDRMSMSHSLESRVPFLDHRLVELTYRVHKNVKLPGLRRKELLRKTIGRRLPPALLNAPKMPFSVPLREWFKQEEFSDRLSTLVNNDFGLNRAVMHQVIESNKAGNSDYGDFIWRLFVLKDWMDEPMGSLKALPTDLLRA